jgi:hypothetical protein
MIMLYQKIKHIKKTQIVKSLFFREITKNNDKEEDD